MIVIPIDPYTQRAAWLKHKETRISATDVPAILGYSKWGTPLSVWARLTDQPLDEKPDNSAMEFGRRSEKMHVDWYCDDTKRRLVCRGRYLQDEEFDWFVCTTDAEVEDETLGHGVLETKAPTFSASEWDDNDFPAPYKIQVQVQLRISGHRWGSASALVQPRRFHRDVEFDQSWNELVMGSIIDFREKHVLTDIPPEAGGSEIDRKVLNSMFAPITARQVFLPPELVFASEEIREMEESLKTLDHEVDARKNQIRQFFVNEQAEEAIAADGTAGWSFKMRAGFPVAARIQAPVPVLTRIKPRKARK